MFANVTGRDVGDGTDAIALVEYVNTHLDPSLTWRVLDWFRENGHGPIVLKGIQTVEDSRLATDAGMEAVALSNYGGRQLYGSPATLNLVPEVAQAMGDQVEIICVGAIRRGIGIVKALALGADAGMAGHPYLYGPGAGGERGVEMALEILRSEFHRTMALIGSNTVAEIGTDHVARIAQRPTERQTRRTNTKEQSNPAAPGARIRCRPPEVASGRHRSP